MKHSVPHDLGRAQAKRVAEAAWGSYSQRFSDYSPVCRWTGDYSAQIGFRVKGVSLDGVIEVNEKDIAIDLDVPFLLRPFKGQALRVIEDEIKNWIGKSKAGQI